MTTLSRRSFLLGSAAVAVPLTSPACVAWFAKWFDSKRFWDLGRPSVCDDRWSSYYRVVYDHTCVPGTMKVEQRSEDGGQWREVPSSPFAISDWKGEREVSSVNIGYFVTEGGW